MSLLRKWKWELLSMVISLGLLAGIIITLGRYNHSQQPEWPYNININSLASVITAVIIAQLGFILAEIISQLKWSWFQHPHPLQDLEDYDAASRGMIGSLTFLGRFARQPRAYLAIGAAFVLVTSAAIGPFTQQSIKSYACQRPLHNITASIPSVNWINSSRIVGNRNAKYRHPNMEMMVAALEGIIGSANDSRQVPFDCPTGNCDFDSYSSLAYCSSCVDLTSHVQEAFDPDDGIDRWNYTLPGMGQTANEDDCQLRFNDIRGHPLLGTKSATGSLPTQLVMCGGDVAVPRHRSATNLRILSISWANCSRDHEDGMPDRPGCGVYPEQLPSLANTSGLVAMKCNLGLCIKDYTGRVRNGVLDERTTGRILPELFSDDDGTFRMVKLPCTVDAIKYDRSNISQVPSIPGRNFTTVNLEGGNATVPLECVYETDEDVPWAIDEFLGTELFQPREYQDGIGSRCGLNTLSKASWCDPWHLGPLFHDGRLTAETISADMDGIALSISNRMRVVGSNAYRNGSGFAPGKLIQTTVCVKVEWPWLILPATLVLLTGSLFIWVAITAGHAQIDDGRPVWKSSALVAFFHGIDTRSLTPGTADENTAGPVGSPRQPENSPASISSPRSETDGRLMFLEDMQATAKRLVVKLETAAPGRGGFLLVNEAQDKHHLASNEQNKPRRSADLHLDGETLPLSQLPRHDSAWGRGRTFLHVDLGTGFAPSVRDSLNRSRQPSLEDSLERGPGNT